MTTDVINAALYRAFIISVLLGASATLTTRQITDAGWEDCVIVGVSAFITAFLARGFGEGSYDAKRAIDGNVNKGDVPVASAKVDVTVKP